MTDAVPSTANNPLFRYPAISLGEAVEKIRKLYQKIHRRRMSREEIAQNLGYTTLNGASTTVISNLTRYGLLVGRQDGVGLSNDGITIAIEEDTNSPDRQAAIRRAAFTPEIFKQLSEYFGTDPLPVESSVRIRLEKLGFPRKQAEIASRAFCETMALVMAEGGAYNQSQVSPEGGDQGGTMLQTPVPQEASTRSAPIAGRPAARTTTEATSPLEEGGLWLQVPFRGADLSVRIEVKGMRLAKEHVERVVKYLELAKDDLETVPLSPYLAWPPFDAAHTAESEPEEEA
ncbi:MAG TPA: hypothetical protein VGS07_18415 [Thermoanaerobaculia bacterium]|jgi:hypothetical protein|nr:hypothetical protein [Thermoanaerobaculia bacterium]